jgi:hypothetical protein
LNICAKIENEFMEHIKKSRFYRIRTPFADRMTLLVQTSDEEEL